MDLRNSPGLVPPKGHYSHVAIHGGLAHISGQIPVDSLGNPLTDADFLEQTLQVLHNVDECLTTAGTDRSQLVSVTVYLTDIADRPEFDALYADWIGEHRPARAVVAVAQLNHGSAITVQAMAAVPSR